MSLAKKKKKKEEEVILWINSNTKKLKLILYRESNIVIKL